MRMTEGLRLKWAQVDIDRRILTVEASKNYKTRTIPLSEYALELLNQLPRIDGNPHVFVSLETMRRIEAPRRPLYQGRKEAKLEWVGFHDLRHFRATQWISNGVDVRTVQELLGHRDIATTMRYSHYAPQHATQSIREVQKREAERFVSAQEKNRRKEETPIEAISTGALNLLIPECRKEDSNLHPLARTRT